MIYWRFTLVLYDYQIRVDNDQVASYVLNFSLYFLIDHDFVVQSIPGKIFDLFLMGHGVKLLQMFFIECLVVVSFVESDYFVDVSVLLF